MFDPKATTDDHGSGGSGRENRASGFFRLNCGNSYHHDVFADVLYLCLASDMETHSLGDENEDGDIELREAGTDRLIGLTVISGWKRFGAKDRSPTRCASWPPESNSGREEWRRMAELYPARFVSP